MSALYRMTYTGSHGEGFAVVYIGQGLILGMDQPGSRIHGTYTEDGGRLRGSMTLTGDTEGHTVGGQIMKAGQSAEMEVDWDHDFAAGRRQQITLLGEPLQIVLQKIGNIP
jgi:hypothetical protein